MKKDDENKNGKNENKDEKNEVTIFTNDKFGEIRTVEIDCEPWFVGKDVAESLGYSNTRDALSRHIDNEDKTSVVIPDSGSNYKSKTILINSMNLVFTLSFSVVSFHLQKNLNDG